MIFNWQIAGCLLPLLKFRRLAINHLVNSKLPLVVCLIISTFIDNLKSYICQVSVAWQT
jgi:hypothetical protein